MNNKYSILLVEDDRVDQLAFKRFVDREALNYDYEIVSSFREAKKLLTEAQNTAESHGLSLLSQKISREHDNLLEQLNEWQTLKNNKVY